MSSVSCLEWGIEYLRWVVPEPEGFELGIMWQEHDLGDYPSIGVQWDGPWSEPPSKFMRRCEEALRIFDRSVEWASINPSRVGGRFDEEDEALETDDGEDEF